MASFLLSTSHLLHPSSSSSHHRQRRHHHRSSSSSSSSGAIWCHAHLRRSATHLAPSCHVPIWPDSRTGLSVESGFGRSTRWRPWMHGRICAATGLSSGGGSLSGTQQQQQQGPAPPPTGAATIPIASSSPSSAATADPAAKPPPKPFSFFEPKKPQPPIPLEDFHYVMYATETMDDFEPPSPPSIPFGGPFEDYYGEIIGEDYIPKQEKPTSSFLMFLDSLNEKRTDLKKEEVPMPEGGFPESPSQDGDEKKKPLDSYTPLFQHRHTPQSPKRDAVPYTPLFRNDVPPPLSSPSPSPSPQPLSPPPPSNASKPSTQSSSPPPVPAPAPAPSPSPSPSQQQPYTSLFPQNSPPPPPPPPPSPSQQKPFISAFSPSSPPPSPMGPQQQKPYGFPPSGPSPPPPPVPQQRPYAAPFPRSGPPPPSPFTPAYSPSSPPPPPPPPSPMAPQQQKPYGFPPRGPAPPPPLPQERPYAAPFPRNGPPPPPPLPPQQTPYSPMFPQSGHPPPRPPPQQTYAPGYTQGGVPPPPPAPVPQHTSSSRSSVSAVEEKNAYTTQLQQNAIAESSSISSPLQNDASNRNPTSSNYFQGQSLGSRDSSGLPLITDTRATKANRGPLFSQAEPPESTAGISYPTPGVSSNVKALEYYEPEDGDIILGAVISSDEDELEIEIGARLPAILSFGEFNPHPQMIENIFFKLPNADGNENDGFVAPYGKSLIVEDKSVVDGSYQGGVEAGTVFLAEVRGRTLTDGRAVLSCRSLARRISWNRIAQLMQTGETVELEIMQYNEGGLLGYLEGTRAFLPKSELLQKPESSASLKDYVGKVLQVAVTKADIQASNCIMSEVKAWMSKNLLLGSVHNVTVTRLYPYGMQVEIENTRIRGFVHISNISKEYVSSVATFFTEGEQARVMLIKGRNPDQVSFSTAELERERGLMLRNKAQVYEEAEEAARSYYEGLSQKEREIFSLEKPNDDLQFQDFTIANLKWLHIGNGKKSN